MKFIEFLNENEVTTGTTIKGFRSSKLNRKGETSLKYVVNSEDKKLKVLEFERYDRSLFVVSMKTEKYDTTADGFKFEKVDKAGIDAFYNYKITEFRTDIRFVKETDVKDMLSRFNAKDDRVIFTEKANKYLENTIEESDEEPGDEELFAIGYWANAYGKHEREYFWMSNSDGEVEDKKEMKRLADRKCKYGQPRTFHDFVEGSSQVFTNREKFLAAAKKVGLNPKL